MSGLDDPTIYYVGVVNPAGESPTKVTTYFDKWQLAMLAPRMRGLPMHIDHNWEVDGVRVPPSGMIHDAWICPETEQLIIKYSLNEAPTGKLAHWLQSKSHDDARHKMFELSIGYDIGMQKKGDRGEVPVFNFVREVSICWKGARKNTHILHPKKTKAAVPPPAIKDIDRSIKPPASSLKRPRETKDLFYHFRQNSRRKWLEN